MSKNFAASWKSFVEVISLGMAKVVAKYQSLKWYAKAYVVFNALLSFVNWWALSALGTIGFFGGLVLELLVLLSTVALLGVYSPKDHEAPAVFMTINYVLAFWSLWQIAEWMTFTFAIFTVFVLAIFSVEEERKKAELELTGKVQKQ